MGRAMITHEEEEYSLSHEVACEQMLVEEKEVVKRHLRLDRAQRHVVVLLRDRGDEAVLVRRAAGLQAREGKLRVVAVHLVPGVLQKLARILHADVAVAVAVFAHKGFQKNVAALLLERVGRRRRLLRIARVDREVLPALRRIQQRARLQAEAGDERDEALELVAILRGFTLERALVGRAGDAFLEHAREVRALLVVLGGAERAERLRRLLERRRQGVA